MQIDHAQEQCRRQGCSCSVPNGQTYCSEQCRLATEGSSSQARARNDCVCGHDECDAGSRPHADEGR